MEKLLSDDERIKKAEEIYYRRRMNDNTYKVRDDNEIIKTNRPVKKMLDIIVFCLLVYTIFYTIQNRNYIFTQEFLNNVNQIFCVDLKQKIEEFVKNVNANEGQKENAEGTTQNPVDANTVNTNAGNPVDANTIDTNAGNPVDANTIDTNTGNPVDTNKVNTNTSTEGNATSTVTPEPKFIEATLSTTEDSSSLNQMSIDAEEIKNNYSIVKPIEGTITSEFGVRDLDNISVSGYHTGLDIAANYGDDIVSAIDGNVSVVSSYGAYGKHIKITNGDVTTLYAHCNLICVNEGDEVSKGQKIAEAGSTGNSTGPHLHFEIQRDDRYVDPEYLLDY